MNISYVSWIKNNVIDVVDVGNKVFKYIFEFIVKENIKVDIGVFLGVGFVFLIILEIMFFWKNVIVINEILLV